MSTFPLQIVTPYGLVYDGVAEKLVVRTIDGERGILARHCNYVTALGMGEARVYADGTVRRGACIGGMLAVTDGAVRLVPTTFEWAEEIDAERAKRSEERAREKLANARSARELELASARLKRALVRGSVASHRGL